MKTVCWGTQRKSSCSLNTERVSNMSTWALHKGTWPIYISNNATLGFLESHASALFKSPNQNLVVFLSSELYSSVLLLPGLMWYMLDSICHGSKRSSSCCHVDVRVGGSIVMNMYRTVHVREHGWMQTHLCLHQDGCARVHSGLL